MERFSARLTIIPFSESADETASAGRTVFEKMIDMDCDHLDFSIAPTQSIQRVQFEPADDYLVMDLQKITICHKAIRYEPAIFSSNAVSGDGQRLVFATRAPQIRIHIFGNPVSRVSFKIRYVAMGREAVPFILDKFNEDLIDHRSLADRFYEKNRKYEHAEEKLKIKLTCCEDEAAFLKNALAAERQVREKILQSSSWKITAPIRKLSRLVKRYSILLKVTRCWINGDARRITESGLFDEKWYLANNRDAAQVGGSPLAHYLFFGAVQEMAPHPLFDPVFYQAQNPALNDSNENPLRHYLMQGAADGRSPHPLFDPAFYLGQNPEVVESGENPLGHYVKKGAKEGKAPHPLFDPDFYQAQNFDPGEGKGNPLVHYITKGAGRGLSPHPLFDPAFYLSQDPGLAESGGNPLAHYITTGAGQGLSPHPLFDPAFYLSQNPGLAESGANLLVHYLSSTDPGDPSILFDTAFYLSHYRQARESSLPPLVHYIVKGAGNGLNPNRLFDSGHYLRSTPGLGAGNPLAHYSQNGDKDGRNPNPLFIGKYYAGQVPDAESIRGTLIDHYRLDGWKQGLNPGPIFNTRFYLEKYPDVKKSGMDPLSHYLEIGIDERRSPNPIFDQFNKKPEISILVFGYADAGRFLPEMLRSAARQIYPCCEVIIMGVPPDVVESNTIGDENDFRLRKIKIRLIGEGSGPGDILTRACRMADGEFIAFLDGRDLLAMDALYEVARAIHEKDADILYSDEGLIDMGGHHRQFIFKPDYNPDFLLSQNYISNLLVAKKELLVKSGGVDIGCGEAWKYDLALKLTETGNNIHHIPKVLYYRRGRAAANGDESPVNSGKKIEAGRRALESALVRRRIRGTALVADAPGCYRVKREIRGNPLVSIIIPFRDQPRCLEKCIRSILAWQNYPNFEIIGINNDSRLPETGAIMEDLGNIDGRIRFIDYPIPFNYSKINNFGVSMARGSLVLLLNNDIEMIHSGWLEALIEHAQRDEVGAVGGKLLYPDHSIQHAGVVVGIAGFAGHSHRHADENADGYQNRLKSVQNVSAVTGAMMMVKRKLYVETGGLDEDNLPVSLNDIDFCLELRKKEMLNVFTPHCRAVHHESVSRGYEETAAKRARFRNEIAWFRNKWKNILDNGDPYYNPNLSLETENFFLADNKIKYRE